MTTSLNIDFSGFIKQQENGQHTLNLAVDGMSCAGCAFKIEKLLNAQANVNARVNVTEKRLSLIWTGDTSIANDLLHQAASLGFQFSPLQSSSNTENTHTNSLLRYLAVSGFAAGNIMVFSFALWFTNPASMGIATRTMMHWYSALLALPCIIYAGQPFFKSAYAALKNKRTNMDVPISVALILTSMMSLFETINNGDHAYFDSVTMLLFLLLIGRYLDAKARRQTRSAAADLLSLMSGTATIEKNNTIKRIPAADIKEGMTLLIAKGEKILVDGYADTDAIVNSAAIDGETLPRTIERQECLFAGMINMGDSLRLIADKTQKNSLISNIIDLMQKAEQGNALYVRAADRIASWYTPAVHALAFATFISWAFIGHLGWQDSLMRAITVLIITCPCALGLAVPVAQVVAGNMLFRHGILLKSADALERMDKIDTIVFDKTGTLTKGDLCFENKDQFTQQDLLIISSLASQSHHPLARAAVTTNSNLIPLHVIEKDGLGIEAQHNGQNIKLGSAKFVKTTNTSDDSKPELWFEHGNAAPQRLIFSDIPHSDAKKTIAELKKKYKIFLLSGDRDSVAKDIAKAIGIDTVQANINPKQKYDYINELKNSGHHTLMVGDGLNDAAAMAQAQASMSPSSAIDIAQNTADLIYQKKGISSVAFALDVARRTQRIVKQNFSLALGYNIIAIPLAMAGYVTPLVAAASMSLSSLLVVFNALRLNKEQKWIS